LKNRNLLTVLARIGDAVLAALMVKAAAGRPVAGMMFAIYNDQEGGGSHLARTTERDLDEQGRYTVLLGNKSRRFASGAVRCGRSALAGRPARSTA
jgi:hypothetical protein